MQLPLFMISPRPHLFWRNKTANGANVGTTVVTDLADKAGSMLSVVGALEVATGSPQMLFGSDPLWIVFHNNGGGKVRRARKVRSEWIVAVYHLRNDFPAEPIVLRRQALLDILCINFIISTP